MDHINLQSQRLDVIPHVQVISSLDLHDFSYEPILKNMLATWCRICKYEGDGKRACVTLSQHYIMMVNST